MSSEPERLLFIPVSGPRGMGEYARSVAIAGAAARRWPRTQIRFVLSAAAPYAAHTPFPATLLPSSPTFHPREVAALIQKFRPSIVVFDNAGRTAQLQAARASGARIVFVSSRRRQRRKAFRMRWMTLIDEHWIAYPEFIAGSLTTLERFKLWMRERPRVRYLDTILPASDAQMAAAIMARLDVRPGAFVLVVPGGGSAHPGAENAPEIFAAAARRIAQRGNTAVVVGIAPQLGEAAVPELRFTPRLPMEELCELIRGARVVISNGGDTLLQVLACGRAGIGVPIAGDQAHRIARCVDAGLAVGAQLEARAIASAAFALLDDDSRRRELESRAAQQGVTNGLETVLTALAALT